METITPRFRIFNFIALLLTIPTAYFIVASLLKYNFGIDGPYDVVYPLLQQMGINNSLGWNINLLILFGPVLALLVSLLQLLHMEWHFTR